MNKDEVKGLITISGQALVELINNAVEEALDKSASMAELPPLLKFPEDVLLALRANRYGHIKEATVRWWKTQGWIKTEKIGRTSYVKREEFERFIKDNRIMMAGDSRNRGKRLAAA